MSSSAKTWHPDPKQLAAFAEGSLPAAEGTSLQAHLDQCPACRKELDMLRGGAESMSGQATLPPVGAAKIAASPPLVATTTHQPGSDVPADLVNHPRYEVLQLLGQGGMGAVYKARHKKMDRLVALKIINAQLLGNEKAVERFHREVQAAAKLQHVNIVTAHDADQAGSTHFLVMEFVEGTDLAKYVEKKGPLPVHLACHFIRQAALGLQHAHEHGMVHRDIKPHNLMLTPQGVVKVMDFGLARLARAEAGSAGLTGENVLMGTADYIAPEQAEDAHKADIRADIYSLGCSLFHLLAGKPPFAGGTVVQKIMAHAAAAVPWAELPATVPDELRTVLAKMVEKNPAQRYQSPGEVALALAPFIKKPTGVKPPPVPAVPVSAPARVATVNKESPSGFNPSPARPRETTPAEQVQKRTRGRGWLVPAVIGTVFLALLLGTVVLLLPGDRPRTTEKTNRENDGGSPSKEKQPAPLPATFTNSLDMEFVLVPKGKAWLGGGGGKFGDQEVEIAQDFYLGKYEVTQEEWQKVTGTNPSHFWREGPGKEAVKDIPDADVKRFPVESVSWHDVQLFLRLLNTQVKEPGWIYRLPKESEWEFACRGGPMADRFESAYDFYIDKPLNELRPDQINSLESGKGRTCKVGSYKPNRLGLHDMHGNVWEWCDDAEAMDRPVKMGVPGNGELRRLRLGGGWIHESVWGRAASRMAYPQSFRFNDFGLRVARVPVANESK